MKRVILLAGMVVMVLMAAGLPAQAALVESNIFDPIDNWTNPNDASDTGTKIKPSNPSYPALTFDLTLMGYTPGTPLTSAELILDLADDSAYRSNVGADVTIALQGGDTIKNFIVDGARKEYLIDISDADILAELTTGILSLTLGVNSGGGELNNPDFILYDAQMKAEAVPLPAAVLLLGSGLIGLAGLRRRGLKK